MKISRLFRRARKPGPVGYEESKRLATNRDEEVRAELAASPSVKPEVLYYLTDDGSEVVRRNVAGNANTPVLAQKRLATDEAPEVRAELARKIGKVIPDLTGEEAEQLREQTIEVLEMLAADQLPSIRAILSESLKDSLQAPRHVILRLAHDVEEIVASPVLEYSPLLSEVDLLEVIASGVAVGALPAIARRKDISETLSEAVAASLDMPAVAALLANPSAHIREETLDQIIEQAEYVKPLHEPLVMRLDLSVRALRRIAGFVGASLVEKLVERHNLSAEIENELKRSVRSRIEETDDFSEPKEDKGQMRAQDMFAGGRLDESAMLSALEARDISFLQTGLSLLSRVEPGTVRAILKSRNGKVIAALCRRADLSMRTALRVQSEIAHVPHGKLVNARNGVEYPLTDKEMDWQLSFYTGD
ncbi:DUF2336 domain-containing protein [Sneathiella chinensis]|uniref:DUF2336 domain-containing protein n=1 Tax=Sneathiella chinensis TaxID=349750 RepID=A0ABQ5U2G6_9PROT|nr:DUF2336 domain-containing protein [Sneathiella chinensis]GLQ05448.1 hypothetical protein GCM10007924_06690 [Sneathiella chinensis]